MKVTAKYFVLASALAFAATPAFAKPPVSNPPTLHGFCSIGNVCTDNGTNTPTAVNPPVFGFSAGGHDATGDVSLAILVPDNLAKPGSFTISGFDGNNYGSGTASLFSGSAWTSGELDDFLGISASPTNPIGAYLPATLDLGQNADGYWVYFADLGTLTLPSNGNASDAYLLTLGQDLAVGGYIVGFINQSGNYGATANSGAILEDGPPPPGVPEPATWAMMIAGFGVTGFAMRRNRRSQKHVSQLA